jgi:hypothetical protein
MDKLKFLSWLQTLPQKKLALNQIKNKLIGLGMFTCSYDSYEIPNYQIGLKRLPGHIVPKFVFWQI